MDDAALADQHRALDAVLQLAHVAGPVVAHEHVDGGGGDAADVLAVGGRVLLHEVIGQERHVRPALAQRRQVDVEDVQPVIEVLAEDAGLHRGLQVLVGGRDQADVDLDGPHPAQPLDLPLLEDAQQLHLGGRADLPHLVQEQRAAVGQLEAAFLLATGVGEGPGLVAEQLRLDQALGQGPAAHLHEGLARARRVVVDGVGHELLARARLAPDEHGGVGGRDLGHLVVHLLHRPAVADEVADVVALAQLLAELRVLVEQALALRLHELVDAQGLADHRAGDREELRLLVPGPVLAVGERHPQGAHRLVVHTDGNADVRHLVLARALPHAGAVQEEGLPADLGHDHRLPALHHPARDPFADLVPRAARGLPAHPHGGLDGQVAGRVVEERHRAAARAVVLLQDLEDAQQGRLQVEGGAEGLADLEQVGQLTDLGGRGHGWDGTDATELAGSAQWATEM